MNRDIVITMGDPQGIGPEIICRSLLDSEITKGATFSVVGHRACFEAIPEFEQIKRKIEFFNIDGDGDFGSLNAQQSGAMAAKTLEKAVALIKADPRKALVTAPICKEHMAASGFEFPGHTEYLCSQFSVNKYAMMLFHDKLRVVLSTIHIPYSKVSQSLSQAMILEKLQLLCMNLRDRFSINRPRVAVCGLNPHGGEAGLFGHEEQEIIAPAIKTIQGDKKFGFASVSGPHAPDTVFHFALQGNYDAVLCHYHDQGLIPIKTTGFDQGVNLTLGLPFIRTSPDHGTAFDIAGKQVANPNSMKAAITAAKRLKN